VVTLPSHDTTIDGRARPAREAWSCHSWLVRRVRTLEQPLLRTGFVLLAAALAFGRVSLPLGLEFGYRSCARNLALLLVACVLLDGTGRSLPRSSIGARLVAFLIVAAASLASSEGGAGNLRVLASAVGVFYAARRVAAAPGGARWLWHVLGLIVLAVLGRELWHAPSLLALRAAQRLWFVTENPNTLGFLGALLTPIFLAGTAQRRVRRGAWVYATASSILVLMTYSRAAWGGLALGSATIALASAVRAPSPRSAKVLVAPIALALATLAIGVLSVERTVADTQRTHIVATSLSLFREHPLLGIGFGTQSLERSFPQRHLEIHGESLFLFHSHNLVVDVLAGTGVVGFAAALALLLAIARSAAQGVRDARSRAGRSEAIGYAVAVGVYLLLAMADNPLYHGRTVLVTAIVWALTESAQMHSSTSAAHKSSST